jgi:hypothetical protein
MIKDHRLRSDAPSIASTGASPRAFANCHARQHSAPTTCHDFCGSRLFSTVLDARQWLAPTEAAFPTVSQQDRARLNRIALIVFADFVATAPPIERGASNGSASLTPPPGSPQARAPGRSPRPWPCRGAGRRGRAAPGWCRTRRGDRTGRSRCRGRRSGPAPRRAPWR